MIKMPWNNTTSPNAMLEITDACNINCRVCYKEKGELYKSLSQVEEELTVAMQTRKLHTITISGGEPTLHPDLNAIIRMCKSYNLHVFLLTNGVLINSDYLAQLKASGLDSIMFHIDEGQVRPDLSDSSNPNDIQKRLNELILCANPLDIDVSMSMTMYGSSWNQQSTRQLVEYFMSCPDLTFLFISKAIDPDTCHLNASLSANGTPDLYTHGGILFPPSVGDLCYYLGERYNLEPYSFIPAVDHKYSCWISFFVPVIYTKETRSSFKVLSNRLDSMLMEIPRKISGHYIHKTTQNSFITLLRAFVNAVSTWRIIPFFKFLAKFLRPSSMIRHKMIVYDNGPFLSQDSQLQYCEYCPTAIVHNGSVAPCCSSNFNMSKGQLNEHTCDHSMV